MKQPIHVPASPSSAKKPWGKTTAGRVFWLVTLILIWAAVVIGGVGAN